MEDDQGTVAQSPQQAAVDAEFVRIIRAAEAALSGSSYRPWLFRIIRTLRPDITRARWRELAGVDAAVSWEQDPREQDRRVHAWLQERGDSTCCPDCNRRRVIELRAQGIVPPWETEEEDEPERTCACDGCEDRRCQGDCESCDDHGCEQCYRDHEVSDCCGFCEECDRHPSDVDTANYNRCAECNHCSECEHYCR